MQLYSLERILHCSWWRRRRPTAKENSLFSVVIKDTWQIDSIFRLLETSNLFSAVGLYGLYVVCHLPFISQCNAATINLSALLLIRNKLSFVTLRINSSSTLQTNKFCKLCADWPCGRLNKSCKWNNNGCESCSNRRELKKNLKNHS